MMFSQYSSRNQRAKGLKVKHVFKIALLLAFCVWLIYQIRNSHEKRKTYVEGSQNTLNGGDGNLDFGRKMKFEFTEGMRNNSDDRKSDQIIGDGEAEDDELNQKTEEKTEEENLNREHEESQGIGVHPGRGTFGNEQYTQEESQNNEEKNIDVVKKEDDTPQEEGQNDVEDSSNNQMKDGEEDAESRTREPDQHIPEGEKEFESQEEGSEERKREQDSPQKKELQSNEKYNSKDGNEEETPQENEQESNQEDISDNKIATAEEGEKEQENQESEGKSDREENSDVRILNEEGKNEQETINETIENREDKKPESDKTKDPTKNTSESKDRRMEENWYESAESESQTNSTIRDIVINNGFSDYGNFSVVLNESRGETEASNSKVENISRSDNQAEPGENTTFREGEISNRYLVDTSTHNQAIDEAVGNQEVNETTIATHYVSNYDTRAEGEVTLKSFQTSAESNTDMLEGQVVSGYETQ